jgi:ABC-type glycerol-3-phosphate transport system substrate-binding protein
VNVNRRLLAVLLVIACCLGVVACGCSTTDRAAATAESVATSAEAGDAILARAFAERTSDLEVEGQGTVVQLLTDDTSGARHQRFIVQLASGQTLLIVHDIDIAPRVGSLQVGHTVSFKGEYVWNAQGGLVHWTHHDPTGSHEAGWIKYDGQTYE